MEVEECAQERYMYFTMWNISWKCLNRCTQSTSIKLLTSAWTQQYASGGGFFELCPFDRFSTAIEVLTVRAIEACRRCSFRTNSWSFRHLKYPYFFLGMMLVCQIKWRYTTLRYTPNPQLQRCYLGDLPALRRAEVVDRRCQRWSAWRVTSEGLAAFRCSSNCVATFRKCLVFYGCLPSLSASVSGELLEIFFGLWSGFNHTTVQVILPKVGWSNKWSNRFEETCDKLDPPDVSKVVTPFLVRPIVWPLWCVVAIASFSGPPALKGSPSLRRSVEAPGWNTEPIFKRPAKLS